MFGLSRPLTTGVCVVVAAAVALGATEAAVGHQDAPAPAPKRVAVRAHAKTGDGKSKANGKANSKALSKDYALIARDIMPSGEYGSYPTPANATDQAQLYNALTPLGGHVTTKDVYKYFIPMTLGTDIVGKRTDEQVPHPGVTIYRDKYDIPHIIGQTRDDVTWGAGWVMAEDRSLLLGEARGDAYLAAINAPGYSALNEVSDGATFTPSAQTLSYVNRQTKSLLAAGTEGKAVLHDLNVYLQGMNAYTKLYTPQYAPYTLADIYAFNALKDQFVGEGGGQQAANGEFLSSLEQQLGVKKGYEVWNSLREANDPEAPVSVPGTVKFQPKHTSDSGNVMLDPNSLSSTANAVLKEERTAKHYASNALLISGARSSTGHPIMVAGPQIGYFYPGLTMEEALKGPGIDQIGATSAPFPGYIFIGRSQDQAWSLTSAGLDQITTYVEFLCDGSTDKYMYDGRCRNMTFFNAGTLTPFDSNTSTPVQFWMTVNGPVIGYATVKGREVALTQKRASTGKDVDDLLFYYELAHNDVHNVQQFFAAAAKTPQTFNSLYINDKDIAVYTSGLVPIQPANVDQDLPVNGSGGEEWRGFVSAKEHPQGINPPSGEIVNWNNRTEAGYEAPDDNWSLGPVQRVSLLLKNLGTGKKDPAQVVSAMNLAATQDVDDVTIEPLLAKVLSKVPAPSARDEQMLQLLNQWYRQGSSLLDTTDPGGQGNITSPGAAILLTAWPDLADAWASSVLGTNLTTQFNDLVPDDSPPPGGQYTGWYVYMDKDLRNILGMPVRGRYPVKFCGGGNVKVCATDLWNALDEAGNTLQAQQGPDPADWRVSATSQDITFTPGLLTYKMRYTNRPSGIQQVISFGGHVPGDQ